MSSVSPSLSPKGAFGIRGPLGTVPAWLGLLGFLHAVGLTGVAVYDANLVLDLTVFNLLLSAAVILGFGHRVDTWRWLLTAYLTYGVEVVGVQTGFPFGDYTYGTRLGPTLYDVPHDRGPLAAHPHWGHVLVAALDSSCGTSRRPPAVRHAASLMVAMDFIIEPVAMRTGYWQWAGGHIPVENYIAWWIIAFALAWGWRHTRTFRTNPAAGWLLVVQTLFFIGILLLPWTS